MQCNHPFYGYPIFKQNEYVPSFPPPTCMPAPVAYPEVVGEGEVTSMTYPDGSVQYFFLPKNFGTGPYFYKNNSVWLIRSICLPNYIQQNNYDIPMTSQPTCCYSANEKSITAFQLKFHNDSETSTTDLHYFFPSLRTCEWVPRVYASVQAELPTESPAMNNYQWPCSKPCNCNNAFNEPRPCKSCMSVDNASETKMKELDIKNQCNCKEVEEKKSKKKDMPKKQISFAEKKSTVICECDKTDNNVNKNTKVKQETDKTSNANIEETMACKCHGEESNAQYYKCEVAEQKSNVTPCGKCTAKPIIERCQCKTAMEKDKKKHKCLCRAASVCPSCNSRKFLNLRRSKCKKNSSSTIDKYCKCECHADNTKKGNSYSCDQNCNEKTSDVSGNCSENTATDDASSSRTSLCDACNSLYDWYNYLFAKVPPATDSSCDHLGS